MTKGPIRLRGAEPTLYLPLVLVALAGLGVGAWVLRYAFTQPTGLDRSALWAGLGFAALGAVSIAAWIALRRRDSRDFVEIDSDAGCYRLIWNDGLYAELPFAGAGALEILRLTKFRPQPQGSAWIWFEVWAPELFFPLYVTDSEADARAWAAELAHHTSARVREEIVSRSAAEELARLAQLIGRHERAGTLDAIAGSVPRVGSWRTRTDASGLQRLLDETRARRAAPS